ncbi:hypothetical protein N9Z27_03115 [Alphaproteobacteria bacterium]|nr:hypothetical protein [Alphaproteobacteria bacterium]
MDNQLLNDIKTKIKEADFVPLSDQEAETLQRKIESAINSNEIEGLYRTDEEIEIDEILNEEKVPLNIRMKMKRYHLERKFFNGNCMKKHIFSEVD